MSIPITRQLVPSTRQEDIRNRVRSTEFLGDPETGSKLVTLKDAEALCELLSHPSVHGPIYSLPAIFNHDTVSSFILQHMAHRKRGEGLLFVRKNDGDEIIGYSAVKIWPQWAAGELTGALHPDHQSKGEGAAGIKATFDWMFSALGLDIICATAALDNIRTEKLVSALGFEFKGRVECERPDGTMRPSKAWEMTRHNWYRN